MAKTNTYKAECRKCKSPVYYYSTKLLINASENLEKKIVDCTCTGEVDAKHTLSYSFPDDFKKLNS